jgi:hypothetical protein
MSENPFNTMPTPKKLDPMIGDFNAKEHVVRYYELMDKIIEASKIGEQSTFALKQEKKRIADVLQQHGVQVTLVRVEDYQ